MVSGGKLIETRANNKGWEWEEKKRKTGRDWAFSRSSPLAFIICSLEPGI